MSQGSGPRRPGASHLLATAIDPGSHAAFMSGLHTTMLVAGIVALAGAAMGPLLRPRQGSGDAPEAASVTVPAHPLDRTLSTMEAASPAAGGPSS